MRNLFLVLCFVSGACFASNIGIVNIATCATDSKYGKNEQEQFEKIKGQWVSLIQETDKELKLVSEQLSDSDQLDGLSPKAIDEKKQKQQALNEDLMKYQGQLNQALSQANYMFIQKMFKTISTASEAIAKQKKFDYVINKDACFFHKADMDVTSLVLDEMNRNYEKDQKSASAEKKADSVIDSTKKVADAKKGGGAPSPAQSPAKAKSKVK